MSDLISGDFNYASVDPDTAAKLEYLVKSGKALYRKHQIQFIADFGKLLSEARELLANHGDGVFAKWAIAEFDISKATVYRYVNAWEKCLSKAGSFHNGTNFMNWSPTALYMLVDDEIPKPIQKKLEKIPATDFVRACDVKRLIAASKPKPVPDDATVVDCEIYEHDHSQTDVLDDAGDPDSEQVEDDPAPVSEPEKPPVDRNEQAKLNRQLAQKHIDAAVRAVDDLNHVKRNEPKRAAAVKALQGVVLW